MIINREYQQILVAFQDQQFNKVTLLATALLKRRPQDAFAWKALGTAQKQLGHFDKAAVSLRKSLEIYFADAECHSNLSSTLTSIGSHDEALQAAKTAVTIDSSNAEAILNLAVALRNKFQYAEAKQTYLQAIARKPTLCQAYVNLGNLYRVTGELEKSVWLCDEATKAGCATSQLKLCLALSMRDAGQLNEAERLCREVLFCEPENVDAHNNLAVVLIDKGFLDQASEHCQSAIRLRPDFAEAYSNLGLISRDLGDPDRAICYYRKAIKLNPNYEIALNNIIFAINCCTKYRVRLANRYVRSYSDYCKRSRVNVQLSKPSMLRRSDVIRVGMVSGDLGMHPVGYFLRSFLAKIDPRRLNLIAYSTKLRNDELSTELLSNFSAVHRIDHLPDRDAAQLIYSHELDILFDLSGHTLFNRLPVFSYKPAPRQVSWLGYFATTGLDEMDYVVAHPATISETEKIHFREKIVLLPKTYFCFSAPDQSPEVSALPALNKGKFTFGCFNSLAKINDSVIACWSEILKRVPDSRLMLKARQYGDKITTSRLQSRFESFGVEKSRIIFDTHSDRQRYLEAYADVDLALDPFPYPGGTTTLEAFWMGVPTLAFKGDRMIGRNADMILQAMSLDEWLAEDAVQYVEKAVNYSADWVFLASLRQQLRDRLKASALMDSASFAEDFTVLCEMICSDKPFTVATN